MISEISEFNHLGNSIRENIPGIFPADHLPLGSTTGRENEVVFEADFFITSLLWLIEWPYI